MEYKLNKKLGNLLVLLLLYMLILPLFLLDVFVEIYHQIGFRLCGIPLVRRKYHIRIDRHKLNYLRWYDKINCVYCGYANGLANYTVEIGARTEKYWCAIKHKNFKGPLHHKDFLEFGDENSFRKRYGRL